MLLFSPPQPVAARTEEPAEPHWMLCRGKDPSLAPNPLFCDTRALFPRGRWRVLQPGSSAQGSSGNPDALLLYWGEGLCLSRQTPFHTENSSIWCCSSYLWGAPHQMSCFPQKHHWKQEGMWRISHPAAATWEFRDGLSILTGFWGRTHGTRTATCTWFRRFLSSYGFDPISPSC